MSRGEIEVMGRGKGAKEREGTKNQSLRTIIKIPFLSFTMLRWVGHLLVFI